MSRAQFADVYPLYALGVLDGAERSEFEAHLSTGCAECREGVEQARGAVASLALAAPPAAPPASARQRLIDRVAADRTGRAPGAREGGERRLPPRLRGGPSLLVPIALASAAAALLYLGVGWMRSRTRFEESERTIALLSRPGTPILDLRAVGDAGRETVARAVYDADRREILLFSQKLTRPAPGKVHVLWLIPRDGAPKNVGAFREDVDRGVSAVAREAPPFTQLGGVAVSEESDPSASAPTKVVAASG
ncbi:MAG TPA: anti-sigma factor [Planctomycetota bacterium]|nr:anti-sigma factor [Planctomycetota bacterium]